MSTLRQQYGDISPGNSAVNDTIYWYIGHVPKTVAHKFIPKLKNKYLSAATPQAAEEAGLHGYDEGAVGGYLGRQQYKVDFDRKVIHPSTGQMSTPDWTLLDDSDSIIGIVGCDTLEPAGSIAPAMKAALQAKGHWMGYPPLLRRLDPPFFSSPIGAVRRRRRSRISPAKCSL